MSDSGRERFGYGKVSLRVRMFGRGAGATAIPSLNTLRSESSLDGVDVYNRCARAAFKEFSLYSRPVHAMEDRG